MTTPGTWTRTTRTIATGAAGLLLGATLLTGPGTASADPGQSATSSAPQAGAVAAVAAKPTEKQARAADRKAVLKVRTLVKQKKYAKARTLASSRVVKDLRGTTSAKLTLQCISPSSKQWPAQALRSAGITAKRGCLASWSHPKEGWESLGFFEVTKKNGKRHVSRHVILAG